MGHIPQVRMGAMPSVVLEPDGGRSEQLEELVDRALRIVRPRVEIPGPGQIAQVPPDAAGARECRAVGRGFAGGVDTDGFVDCAAETQAATSARDALHPPAIDEQRADLVVDGEIRRAGAAQPGDGADRVFELVPIGHWPHASQRSQVP